MENHCGDQRSENQDDDNLQNSFSSSKAPPPGGGQHCCLPDESIAPDRIIPRCHDNRPVSKNVSGGQGGWVCRTICTAPRDSLRKNDAPSPATNEQLGSPTNEGRPRGIVGCGVSGLAKSRSDALLEHWTQCLRRKIGPGLQCTGRLSGRMAFCRRPYQVHPSTVLRHSVVKQPEATLLAKHKHRECAMGNVGGAGPQKHAPVCCAGQPWPAWPVSTPPAEARSPAQPLRASAEPWSSKNVPAGRRNVLKSIVRRTPFSQLSQDDEPENKSRHLSLHCPIFRVSEIQPRTFRANGRSPYKRNCTVILNCHPVAPALKRFCWETAQDLILRNPVLTTRFINLIFSTRTSYPLLNKALLPD